MPHENILPSAAVVAVVAALVAAVAAAVAILRFALQ